MEKLKNTMIKVSPIGNGFIERKKTLKSDKELARE